MATDEAQAGLKRFTLSDLMTGEDGEAQPSGAEEDALRADLRKIRLGIFTVRPTGLELSPLIGRIIRQRAATAYARGLRFSYEIDVSAVNLIFDRYCLVNALQNLVDNAIESTPSGSVTVRLHRDAAGLLNLVVRDSGGSLDAVMRARLLQAIDYDQPGATADLDAASLRLVVARKYLELNDARLLADGRPREGCTYTVRFSRSIELRSTRTAVLAAAPGDAGEAVAGRRSLVLLVEDDPDARALIKAFLDFRYEVLVAESAEEARAALSGYESQIEMILMDIALKGDEDGLALTRELRSEERWRRVPIIVTTALTAPDLQRQAWAAGCNEYLAKPFNSRQLLAKVANCLAAHPA
jgi:CheY-like chemotaxis protein